MRIKIKNKYLRFILKVIYEFRVLIMIILASLSFYYFAYMKTSTTCSRFKEYSSIRGGATLILEYKINNEKYRASMDLSYFKRDKLDSLEYCDCIELEYSVYFPSITKGLVDKSW